MFKSPLVILFILICFIISYMSYKKNKMQYSLHLIFLGGLLLRIYVCLDPFLHEWDERYHALIAKNLLTDPAILKLYFNPILEYNFKDWTSNHIWLHKQPLTFYIMALSLKIFGINEFAVRIPSIIFSSICIYLTFYICKYFYSLKTSLLAAFLVSINGLILDLCSGRAATDHPDILYLFLIELAIYLCIVFSKKINYLKIFIIGVIIGLAILTKWLPALIVLPVFIIIQVQQKNKIHHIIKFQLIYLMLIIIIIAFPWQYYTHLHYNLEANWELDYNKKHLHKVIEGHSGNIFYHINKIRINYSELIYIPLILFIFKLFKLKRILYQKEILLAIWLFIPLIFFSIVKTKMQAYLLFTSPVIFILYANFWRKILLFKIISSKYKYLVQIFTVLLFLLPIRYSIERIKPFSSKLTEPNSLICLKKIDKENIKNCVLFNYNNPIEAMFYTNFTAYNSIPSKSKLDELNAKGYKIFINISNNVNEEYKNIKYIRYLTL